MHLKLSLQGQRQRTGALARAVTVAALTALLTAAPGPGAAQARSALPDDPAVAPVFGLWMSMFLNLPVNSPLDADMQAHAKAMVAELEPLLAAAARRWHAAVRPPGSTLDNQAPQRLVNRLNQSLVDWWLIGPGADHEATEWQLAQHPTFCRDRWPLFEREWSLLADRLLFLQPLQGPAREAALLAERARWRRWLAKDGSGAAAEGAEPPTPTPLLLAYEAAERQRSSDPPPSHPMTPWLARQVLGIKVAPPYGHPTIDCALLQWWVSLEVQREKVSAARAMQLLRLGRVPAVERLLLLPPNVRSAAHSNKTDDYPAVARHQEVVGNVRVRVEIDANGRARSARIVGRQLQMPGHQGPRLPVAFEQALDRGSWARARAHSWPPPSAESLRNGLATRLVEFSWKLD